jgi:hypothetical protein
MTLPDVVVTSEMLWWSALVTALIDVGLVLFLTRRIGRSQFRQLGWPIVLASGVFWMGYGLLLFTATWGSFYAWFLPDPANRSLARFLFELLLYPALGLAMWWLASRLPGNPAVTFCLLGGLEALPEHLWGIFRLGMLDKVPFLREASPISVLAFAVPEYVLYWGSVLVMALPIEWIWQWCRRRRAGRGTSEVG